MTVLLSTKGQLVIPKEVRDRHGWGPGTQLLLEEEGECLILRAAPSDLPETNLADLLGCLAYQGPAISLEEMEEAIARGGREAR
ncbi:MAG: AbrB/MazE/SpoVT family DNA-binding domain-containing protein [Thermoanaerobaculia bacterium]